MDAFLSHREKLIVGLNLLQQIKKYIILQPSVCLSLSIVSKTLSDAFGLGQYKERGFLEKKNKCFCVLILTDLLDVISGGYETSSKNINCK